MVPIFRPWNWAKAVSSGARHRPVVVHDLARTPALRPARREMSTAASVWAARTSTPRRARRAGRCAGLTMSSVPRVEVDGDAMVRARSWTEIGVIPSFASIETGNGVPCLVGLRHHRRRRSWRARSAVIGRQISPARNGHEVHRLGRGELGRDDQVAFVLPVLGVDQHDGTALARVLQDVLDRRDRAVAAGLGCGLLVGLRRHAVSLHRAA